MGKNKNIKYKKKKQGKVSFASTTKNRHNPWEASGFWKQYILYWNTIF